MSWATHWGANLPATTNVRDGITYGPNGSLEGTLDASGALDIDRVNAQVASVQPSPDVLRIVRGCKYSGNFALTWETANDYSSDTIKLVFTSKSDSADVYLVVAGSATSDEVSVALTADFDEDLFYAGSPRQARIDFAVIATDGSGNERPVQLGTAYVSDRGEVL